MFNKKGRVRVPTRNGFPSNHRVLRNGEHGFVEFVQAKLVVTCARKCQRIWRVFARGNKVLECA